MPRGVVLERTLYALAAPVLAVTPNLCPGSPVNTAVQLAGATGVAGWVLAAKSQTPGAGRKILRWAPPVLAAVVDVAAKHTAGWGPWWLDGLLATGWAAAGSVVLPFSRHARRHHRPALATPAPARRLPAATPATPAVPGDGADAFTRGVREMWERAGRPGGTLVMKADRHPGTDHDVTLMLRAERPGRPITGLTAAAVAAALGVTEEVVRFEAVEQIPGRQGGPGWSQAHITPDAARRRRKRPTDGEWWADTIAGDKGPIPGSRFVSKTRDRARKVTFWRARLPETTTEPRLDPRALCKAMDRSYEDGRVFLTLDGEEILVAVWDVSPLATVYPATRELLTPDAEGRWVVGFLANGQPARNRVYTDRGAAHGLYVAPSSGGKTQLMALAVCADANFGAVVWIASEATDEKTTALGAHVDRQGVGVLYMIRALRAAAALMTIRAEMVWADGRCHDWSPGAEGCPYRPLSLYLDEFLSAARDGVFGAEIMDLAETVSVKGRKYAVGEKIAGQSVYVQDGFTQLLCENLRELSIPIVLKVAPKKIADMFKALGVSPEDTPGPLPRSFSPTETGRIERIMKGEPEPARTANTGGVGWIIEGNRPEVLRTLYMDFAAGIDHLFPETATSLTAHEIAELEARGLWFDWTEPPRPGEFGPAPDDEDDGAPADSGGKGAAMRPVDNPRQALEAIKKLTHT